MIKTDFVRFCQDCNDIFKTNFRYATTCISCQVKNIKKRYTRKPNKLKTYLAVAKSREFTPTKKIIWIEGRKSY